MHDCWGGVPACAFTTGPCSGCWRYATHCPTSLCPSSLPSPAQSCRPPGWAQTPFLQEAHRLQITHILQIRGNERFPFGMDENTWGAKQSRLNCPIIINTPTSPLPHIHHILGGGRLKKYGGGHRVRGEEQKAGLGRERSGRLVPRPQSLGLHLLL